MRLGGAAAKRGRFRVEGRAIVPRRMGEIVAAFLGGSLVIVESAVGEEGRG